MPPKTETIEQAIAQQFRDPTRTLNLRGTLGSTWELRGARNGCLYLTDHRNGERKRVRIILEDD